MMTTITQKQQLSEWFINLQGRICAALEKLEDECEHQELPAGRFQRKAWQRHDDTQPSNHGGGGTMAVMTGRVFEKAGVNVSTVHGEFSPEFSKEIPGADSHPEFWASGLSLVIHPLNPYVPIVHMNTRHILTQKAWYGGGADLTPVFPFDEDTHDFHQAMRAACEKFSPDYYAKFKDWCDEYFYIKHRKEARGVGGIFYDYHNTNSFEDDFAFTQAVGEAFLDIYPKIVRRHMHKQWGEAEKQTQLIKRGRYAEFNLIYDRGTKFGLKTDGNIDAILMSLPPMAAWAAPSAA